MAVFPWFICFSCFSSLCFSFYLQGAAMKKLGIPMGQTTGATEATGDPSEGIITIRLFTMVSGR